MTRPKVTGGRSGISRDDLNEPLRRIFDMIEKQSREHDNRPAVSLYTRRELADDVERLRRKIKNEKRPKRKGLTYPCLCKRVKKLIDFGLVVEYLSSRGYRKGARLDISESFREKKMEKKVIVPRSKRLTP